MNLMESNKISRILIFMLFALLVIMILNYRTNLKIKINDVDKYRTELSRFWNENKYVGLDFHSIIDSTDSNCYSYTIVLYLNDDYCTSCLRDVIGRLQKIKNQAKGNIKIAGIFKGKYTETEINISKNQTGFSFPAYSSYNMDITMEEFDFTYTPTLLFIDNYSNKILFISSPKKIYYRDGNFFYRVENFLGINHI